MKAQPRKYDGSGYVECEPLEATHLWLSSPGPISTLCIPVQIKGTRAGTGNWTWNGDVDKPTLRPSIMNDFRPHDLLVNHIWVTDGRVIFLSDCSHDLAGQTLDLLDVK